MGKVFKLTFEKADSGQPGLWFPYYMNGFGKGFSLEVAEVLKKHLESKADYRNVSIVEMVEEGNQ